MQCVKADLEVSKKKNSLKMLSTIQDRRKSHPLPTLAPFFSRSTLVRADFREAI